MNEMQEGHSLTPLERFLNVDWVEHRVETKVAMKQVSEIHSIMVTMGQDTKALPAIASTLTDMKMSLIDKATGKDAVPMEVFEKVIAAQGAAHNQVLSAAIKISALFIGLALSAIASLVGLKFVFPHWFPA